MSLKTNQSFSNQNHNQPPQQQVQQQQQQQKSVDEWLAAIKLSKYSENFKSHQLTSLNYVACLSVADLSRIGISNSSHQKKFAAAIQSLRQAMSIGAPAEGYLVWLMKTKTKKMKSISTFVPSFFLSNHNRNRTTNKCKQTSVTCAACDLRTKAAKTLQNSSQKLNFTQLMPPKLLLTVITVKYTKAYLSIFLYSLFYLTVLP